MKINMRKLVTAAVVILLLGFVFNLVNSFTGNPVSAFVASRKIQDYAAVNYPASDLVLSDVTYNFKNNAYGCLAQSIKSVDTKFYIQYSHGKVSDDYEYEVANHFTTYRRLSKDFDDMVTDIIEKDYPHATTLVIGDLIGDMQQLTPDIQLNLNDIPLQLALTVNILSDVRNEEQMASLLLELHHLMLSRNIPIDQYTLRLEEPMPEESKPGSGNNLYLENFPATSITDNQKNLVAIIREQQIYD